MPLISKITDIDKFDFVHHQVQNYPASITELAYDPKFPVRGLWYDFDAINWMWTEPKVWSRDGQLGENWPGGRGVDLQPWIQIPWQERGAYHPHTVWDDALIVIILNLLPFKKKGGVNLPWRHPEERWKACFCNEHNVQLGRDIPHCSAHWFLWQAGDQDDGGDSFRDGQWIHASTNPTWLLGPFSLTSMTRACWWFDNMVKIPLLFNKTSIGGLWINQIWLAGPKVWRRNHFCHALQRPSCRHWRYPPHLTQAQESSDWKSRKVQKRFVFRLHCRRSGMFDETRGCLRRLRGFDEAEERHFSWPTLIGGRYQAQLAVLI